MTSNDLTEVGDGRDGNRSLYSLRRDGTPLSISSACSSEKASPASPVTVEGDCPDCRGDDLAPVGADMARCRRCAACLIWNRAKHRWSRLAKVFGGARLGKPNRKPFRRPAARQRARTDRRLGKA